MNPKTLFLLEFHKILVRLKTYAGFSVSETLADSLRPTSNLEKAKLLQRQTSQAKHLISMNDSLSFQGAVDMRPLVEMALHGITLEAADLISVRNTLILSRVAKRLLADFAEEVPLLAELSENLSDGLGLVDLINKTISERGEVLDSASAELGHIRSEMKVVHARLMDRMTRYLNDPSTSGLLQELLITQRSGRYVLPIRAENKGRIKAIVHDQSSSGATLFIEPIAVVEWNNKLRELELAERDEVLRVLRVLSQRIAESAEGLNATVQAMAEIDLIFMKARYAQELRAVEPELLPFNPRPPENHPGSLIQLRKARHPLLDPEKVVPIDVEFDRETYAVVLTGPNTGGKTVTLKTVGLAVLMAQSGLQIAAQSGSSLSIFRDVFADIGDEQSIEQSLSTFSGHITQLVRILKRADYRSLVLLDELGAGTDPQEGSALARAVLNHLLQKRITCMVATHYPELKIFAHATKGVVNASLEFDLETLRPTYHLVIGLPGRSNALAIAERLGLQQEIIEAARSEINPTNLRADDLLEEIRRQRDLASENFYKAETARLETESARNKVNTQLEQLESQKADILEKAREQAEGELANLRTELVDLRRQITCLSPTKEKTEQIAAIDEKLDQLEEQHEKKVHKTRRASKPKGISAPIKVGEKVKVRRLGAEGVVISALEDDLEVQVGQLRMRVKTVDVERKQNDNLDLVVEKPKIESAGKTSLPVLDSPGMELDLRGKRVDDALDLLERYLEKCYSVGMLFGRVIHGRGTGAVRQVVREELDHSSYVKRWEKGGDKEGGDGVSVVFFEGQ